MLGINDGADHTETVLGTHKVVTQTQRMIVEDNCLLISEFKGKFLQHEEIDVWNFLEKQIFFVVNLFFPILYYNAFSSFFFSFYFKGIVFLI